MKTKKYFSFSLLVVALLALPQCDLFNSKETSTDEPVTVQAVDGDSSTVLISIDKKPRVTVADFEGYLEEFLEAQPQYRQFIAMMPDAEENIFDSLASETVLTEWVSRSGVDKKAAYQKDLEQIVKYAKRNLAVKYFQDAYPVDVTEAELKKYYDENKDSIPELMLSKGGVKASGITFDSEAAAQAFYEKVKNSSTDFAKVAKEDNKDVKDYGSVSEQSFEIDKPLRDKLLSLKNFTSRGVVKVGDKKWVVFNATAKEETKYVPYDQVRAGLENFLKQQKSSEALMQEIEKLKKQYNVEVNKKFFEDKKQAKQQEMQKAQEQAQAAMKKAQDDQAKKTDAPAAGKSEVGTPTAKPASAVKGA